MAFVECPGDWPCFPMRGHAEVSDADWSEGMRLDDTPEVTFLWNQVDDLLEMLDQMDRNAPDPTRVQMDVPEEFSPHHRLPSPSMLLSESKEYSSRLDRTTSVSPLATQVGTTLAATPVRGQATHHTTSTSTAAAHGITMRQWIYDLTSTCRALYDAWLEGEVLPRSKNVFSRPSATSSVTPTDSPATAMTSGAAAASSVLTMGARAQSDGAQSSQSARLGRSLTATPDEPVGGHDHSRSHMDIEHVIDSLEQIWGKLGELQEHILAATERYTLRQVTDLRPVQMVLARRKLDLEIELDSTKDTEASLRESVDTLSHKANTVKLTVKTAKELYIGKSQQLRTNYTEVKQKRDEAVRMLERVVTKRNRLQVQLAALLSVLSQMEVAVDERDYNRLLVEVNSGTCLSAFEPEAQDVIVRGVKLVASHRVCQRRGELRYRDVEAARKAIRSRISHLVSAFWL